MTRYALLLQLSLNLPHQLPLQVHAVLAETGSGASDYQALWMIAGLAIGLSLITGAVVIPIVLAGIFIPRLVRRLRWTLRQRRAMRAASR